MNKDTLLLTFLACISSIAQAAGWTDISGENAYGETITIVENIDEGGALVPPYYVVDVSRNGQILSKHRNKSCFFFEKKEEWFVSCPSPDTSPLAGATYKLIQHECGDTSYKCVKGCNKSTPTTMWQAAWESSCY